MYHKNQHHHKSKDLPSLFADYITPNGTGVSDVCLEAGALYIKQLNQVFYHFFLPHSKQFLSQHRLSQTCLFQANGQALKMFDASAKVSLFSNDIYVDITKNITKVPPSGQLGNMIIHHPGTFDSCLEVCASLTSPSIALSCV